MVALRVLLCALLAACAGAQKQPFDDAAMMKLARISEPQISPDGRQVAFTVQNVEVAKNAKPKNIYVVPVNGGSPRQLTQEGTQNERPRWSPNSRQIYFVSNRGGSSQAWSMDADGGHARQLTTISTEVSGITISRDGKKMVFLSNVYPECGADDACNKDRLDAEAKNKVKARVYTSLLYRHWTEWQSKRHQHLMGASTDGSGVKDLKPGPHDVPPFSSGGHDASDIPPASN